VIDFDEAKARLAVKKNHIEFPTNMNHLRDHSGFRPGEMHILIGVKGGGKSSLFRSWIAECLFHSKRVYIRLSEESSQDYMDEIVVNLGRVMDVNGLETLTVDSEKELKYDQTGNQYFDDLRIRLKTARAEIFFFDNFTTSELSDCNVMIQGKNAKALRDLSSRLGIPFIVASHTGKGFKGTTIATGDDARGNMTLVNTAPYVYSVNIFHEKPNSPTVLFVDKARHHSKSNKSFYQLTYNHETGLYIQDRKLSRVELAEMIGPPRRTRNAN
jgi:energy-coupling factor transporter ATP-binding protein EcfA2